MRRIVVGAGALLCILFFSNSARAHDAHDLYQQNYQHCYYSNYAYWQPPQLICYPYRVSPLIYQVHQSPPIRYHYRVEPPVVHYHIEIPPPEIKYHFHERPNQPKTHLPEPVLPPAPDQEREKTACLNSGLSWLEAEESVSENVFVPDDPRKRHEEHLKRLGRYNYEKRRFEEWPQTDKRYFGKETETFTARESGCYVRNQSGEWGKINLR